MNKQDGRIGYRMQRVLDFARRNPEWHSFDSRRATKSAVERLRRRGLVEVNEFKQFRIVDRKGPTMYPRYQGQNPIVSQRVMKEQINTWLVMLVAAGRVSEVVGLTHRAQSCASRDDVVAPHKELWELTEDLPSSSPPPSDRR